MITKEDALPREIPVLIAGAGRMSHAMHGGSVALTIPRKLLESVGLDAGDRVSIAIERGRIVLGKAQRPRYRLADLLAQCKGKQFAVDREWLDAPRVGREVT